MVRRAISDRHVAQALGMVGGHPGGEGTLARLDQRPFHISHQRVFVPGEVVKVQMHHPHWVFASKKQVHTHDFYEITYVHSGMFSQSLDGVRVGQRPGELVLIRPGGGHAAWAEHDTDLTFNVLLDGRFVEEEIAQAIPISAELEDFLVGDGEDRPEHLRITCDDAMSHLVENVIVEYLEYQGGRERIMGGLVMLLFAAISAAKPLKPSREEIAVTRMLQRAEGGFRDVTGASLGREFGYSPRHVARLLATHAGIGLTSILNMHRVEHVCRGLLLTEGSVSELAKDAGFTDVNYFYKLFPRVMGLSLREFHGVLEQTG